jgi:ABC-type Fe3+/spermidine/putrescine transport system ATPase subunit
VNIHIEGIVKHYAGQRVIDSLDLEVASGELITLLGASGSGKTTLLRILAGLERADGGRIRYGDTVMQDGPMFVPPQRRGLGMVFQSYALWPHLNIADNLALALRERGVKRAEIAERVDEALATVGLAGLQQRAIHQLSGGQQQRVALARALVARPQVLLMDEPLSNLDAALREQLRDEIRAVQQRLGITTVFVTHDQTEALAISDRIALLHQGKLVALDAPERMYAQPPGAYAAQFLGKANVLSGVVQADGRVQVGTMALRATASAAPAIPASAVQLMIRPEALRWADADGSNTVNVTCRQVQMLGSQRLYTLESADLGCELVFLEPTDRPATSGQAKLCLPETSLYLLPSQQ